jgi:acyl-coenzyme A thioesterase PaaI-like protein
MTGILPTADAVNVMIAAEFPGSGNECIDIGPGYAVGRRKVLPEGIRPGGYVSGPTQFGLADGVLWYMTFAAIGRIEPMALTSELSIRFLRPCVGEVIFARATVESVGSRSIVGSVRVWSEGNEAAPSAVGQGTYVLPRS